MNINNYVDAISNINLFRGFSREELLFEQSKYIIKQYTKGQIIHFQNEVCNFMDIIISGEVLVQKIDENGNILTISKFIQSDVMGANLLFSHKNYYPMTVISKENSIILHIRKELVLELCQRDINFLTNLITTISDKTLILTDKINSIALKTIRECIIDFLIYEFHIQKTKKIKLNMTKKDLAERLGIQRTSLSREFNKMKIDGLIDYDSKTITIKSIDI